MKEIGVIWMKKTSYKESRNTKDVVTLVFLFSLIVGIMLTTYLANQTVGQNAQVTHAAGPQ